MNRRSLLKAAAALTAGLSALAKRPAEAAPADDGYCWTGFRCEARNVWRDGQTEYGAIREVGGACVCQIHEPDLANPGRLILPLNYSTFPWPRDQSLPRDWEQRISLD